MRLHQRAAQIGKRVIGQLGAEHVGKRAQDRPVLARVAGRKRRAIGELHAAFGVDVDAGFFRIGRARQDHVGAVRAAIAVGAEIDDERAGRHLDLVGAEQEQHVERRRASACRATSSPPLPGTKPTSSAPTREAAVCRTEKPFQPSWIAPTETAALAASDRIAAPSGRASAPCPISHDLAVLQFRGRDARRRSRSVSGPAPR